MKNKNRVSLQRALRDARKKGIKDPLVECEYHKVKIRYSDLSPVGLMALEAGLDVSEGECLLLQ